MRVASFDIGTNTVLMLVAEAHPDGPRAIVDRARITRLGEGVDRSRELAPAAIERTLCALSDFAAEARQLGVDRIVAVGTSAMRDARGGDAFVNAAEKALGARPQVISGEREADLTFHGALSGLAVSGPVAVFDIGGGSTEIVVGSVNHTSGSRSAADDQLASASISLDVGSVRLTERFVKSDPPSADELAQIASAVDEALAKAPTPPAGTPLVGIAGTVTTLAAIALGVVPYDGEKVHGALLTASQIDEVFERLANTPLSSRRLMPGLEPKRADVIVAGAMIARRLIRWAGASEIRISDRGVRWGLAIETLVAIAR
jgi:exopolyphosphatase/guanosine-5'-triphosphate,3'-diphosphate pyrophosphatase